ncbi:hypothetical protein ACFLZ0_01445 [Patescibacteria group bacterium]
MKKLLIFILISVLFLSFSNFVFAKENTIIAHFFYGETCPHCKKAEGFLDSIKEKYPNLEIRQYEVFGNKKNAELFLNLLENCGKEKKVLVPAIFIGNDVIIGFLNEETSGLHIEKAIQECSELNCSDSLEQLKKNKKEICPTEENQIISLPFIGEVNLSSLSLPILTVVLAGIDGFNPCAMWVLIFLLALLINIKSRQKMWIIGGIFILSSGVIYFILLSAWLNVFLAISYVNFIRTVIGILAVVFGVLQLKKFAIMRPGVCSVVKSNSKIESFLKNQTEKIVANPVMLASIFGVIVLAIATNLIEFFCSAGLPAIYTHTLSLSNLRAVTYYSYILLYTFIFMFDDLIVFIVAVITLNKLGFTDKYSRYSTLIGGVIILLLGLALILKPELLMFG